MSGDTHGAGLMRALQEAHGDVQFMGLGGAQMQIMGGDGVFDWAEDAGVVGLWEVLKKYRYFKEKFQQTLEAIAEKKPDAVILIDYPGFNLRIAKAIRDAGSNTKIIYYISPQVWAWKSGRIKTMAQVLDLMICIFPFEKELYEKSGLRTVFAGHPMADRVKTLMRGWQREPGLVGFFPGSRSTEVQRIFPVLIRAAQLIKRAIPDARFAVSAANQRLASEMREIIEQSNMPEARQWIEVASSHDLMQRAEVGAVASGTATLEAASFGLPYVLVYRVNALTYIVGKTVVRVKHLGIINILAEKPVVKELVQGDMNAERISIEIIALLQNKDQRAALTKQLHETVATLGEGGAYRRAAEAVISEFNA